MRIILAKKDYPAMYELVEAAKGTYYIASPCNTGLITAPGGDEAWLIAVSVLLKYSFLFHKRLQVLELSQV